MNPTPTLERTATSPYRPGIARAPDRRRRILFAKLGSFSHTNERLLEQLNAHFPDHKVETYDVKDYVKRRYGVTALNALIELVTYGPGVLSNPAQRHAYF